MYNVATEEEIDSLVHKTVNEYKEKVLKILSDRYQPNQKIRQDEIVNILNKVYNSEIEICFFEVEEER